MQTGNYYSTVILTVISNPTPTNTDSPAILTSVSPVILTATNNPTVTKTDNPVFLQVLVLVFILLLVI